MDRALIIALVQNVALLLATGLVLDFYWKRKLKRTTISTQIITGFLLGGIGLMIMFTPAVLEPGLVFDTRSVLLSVSGLFFGWVPAIIAMAITASYRIVMGGSGMWMGIAVILSSGLIGIVWNTIDKEWFKKRYNLKLVLLGYLVHIAMLACTRLLPESIQQHTIKGIIIPLLTLYPFGLWLFGNFLLNRLSHWNTRQMLEESELKFRLFYERSPVAYHSLDEKGNILQVNDAWLHMMGYMRNEVIGRNITEFLRPDYAKLFAEQFLTNPESLDFENKEQVLISRGSNEIIVSVSARHETNLDGTYKSTNFILHNVTERRNSELKNIELNERLTLAAKASGFGVWDWDILNDILFWDKRMCELYGIEKAEHSGVFDLWVNALHPDNKTEAENVKKLVDDGGTEYTSSFKIILPNGAIRHLRVYALVLRGEGGEAYRMIGINFDITEDIRGKIALKESEERFREIIESSIDIHYKQSIVTSKFIYVSPSVEAVLGYTAQEIIAMSTESQRLLFAKEDDNIIDGFRHQILEQDPAKVLELEFRVIDKGGRYHWMHGSYRIKLDSAGKPSHIIGVLRDITEIKQHQQALLKNLHERELILNSIPNIIWKAEVNKQGQFVNTIISSIADELLKLPPNTIQNNWETYFGHILPRYMPDIEAKIRHGIQNPGFTISMEYEARLGNGETAWFFSEGRAYVENGEMSIIGYTSNINDRKLILAELKQSEQMFKSFILNAPDGIFTCNADGIILGANQACCSLLYTDEENLLGKSISGFLTSDNDQIVATDYKMASIGDKNSRALDLYTANGTTFHALLSTIKLSDNKILGFIKDIDDIKKTHKELVKAKEKAEESDRLKTAFLAAMSHELRTPLNSILGFSSLIDDTLQVSDFLRINRMIRQSGFHLLGIVESVFEMALLQTGNSRLNAQTASLSDVFVGLDRLVTVAVDDLQKHSLSIVYQNADCKGISLYTDHEKLLRLLFHLANNALKYTLKGTISIGCKINDNEIVFWIKDTGIGIPPDKAGYIFELFRQGDDSDTRDFGGLGLGLTICNKLAHILKGRLWFESTPGVGTDFYFNLPRLQTELLSENHPHEAIEHDVLKARTILIAEDNDENMLFLNMVFKGTGAKLITVTTGRQAVAKAKEIPDIDLVLMDLKLPELDGYEATRQICKLRPGMPVIAQTAYAMLGDRERALQAGCIDYLTKPMNKDQVLMAVQKALETKS